MKKTAAIIIITIIREQFNIRVVKTAQCIQTVTVTLWIRHGEILPV